MEKLRVHITPDDVLADIDEIADGSEPRSRCKYYIEPYGPYAINEACEANYYPGNRVPYHEHQSGFETFLVDGGAIEILTLSKKAAARKGDIVHIAPYTPHAIHALEENSIWRAFHQGLWLVKGMIEDIAFRDRHHNTFFDPDFRKEKNARNGSKWFEYLQPECRDAAPGELPCLRTYDFALAQYAFEGITLKLKVGRWETLGAKEVWQLCLKSGYKLSWEQAHPHSLLYDVFDGSVRVELEGMEPFTANARDLIHVPKLLGGSITALEDTVLLDMGCQGYLTRYMDELNAYKLREPEKLQDSAFIADMMRRNDYNVLFGSL